MFGDQGVDQLAERLAFHHLRQFVKRQVDAVVGDAALWEVVGADALRTIAGADLSAPVGGARGVQLAALLIVKLGAQHGHRLGLILMLRSLLLHVDDDAAWQMRDADRGFRLVDVLAAGALGTHGVDLEIFIVDFDVDVLHFG